MVETHAARVPAERSSVIAGIGMEGGGFAVGGSGGSTRVARPVGAALDTRKFVQRFERRENGFSAPRVLNGMLETSVAKPHVREPQRAQGAMTFEMPEDSLTTSHPARLLWNMLGGFDLSAFSAEVTSVAGDAGRPQLSPRMMLTLWLFGIVEGIGSARRIARLTQRDSAYRWIVGDLRVSHDTLSAFPRTRGEALDQLMTDVLATLMHKGLLSLDVVSQDGTRTRAAASAPSFRTYGSLLECREQAALHLKAVLAAADDP